MKTLCVEQGVLLFQGGNILLTKEEIKKNLLEDSSWTPSDGATDAEWDIYLEVKKEMTGNSGGEQDLDEVGDVEDDELDNNNGEY